jgi:prephenate dehydratase
MPNFVNILLYTASLPGVLVDLLKLFATSNLNK